MAANQVTTAAGSGWVYLELGRDQVSPQESVMNCGKHTVLYTAALWPQGHQGQQTSPAVKHSSGLSFLFSQLFFPTKQKGHRGNWDNYFTSSLWTLVGRSLSRLLQRFDDETVASLDQPVVEGWRVRGVPWWGSAGFQDCSGKDCLKLKKIFLAEESVRGREMERFRSFRGREWQSKQSFSMFTWNVTKTTFMSLTASLEDFTFGWIYFSVKKEKCFVKVVASLGREWCKHGDLQTRKLDWKRSKKGSAFDVASL